MFQKLLPFVCIIFLSSLVFSMNIQAQILGSGNWGDGNTGVIDFVQKEFDFGQAMQGDTIRQVYVFKNSGTGDLEIKHVKTGCECTSANWKPGPYKMGSTGEIEVVFSTKDKSGFQQKEIVVETNGEKRIEIIRLTGTVLTEDPKE